MLNKILSRTLLKSLKYVRAVHMYVKAYQQYLAHQSDDKRVGIGVNELQKVTRCDQHWDLQLDTHLPNCFYQYPKKTFKITFNGVVKIKENGSIS